MSKGNRLRAARRAGKRCIFCGDPVGSQEHLWPDWLKDSTIVDHTPVNHQQFQLWNVVTPGDPIAVIHHDLKKHDGPPTKHKEPEVCAGCNNGWMSRLENKTKPALLTMIDGGSSELGPHDQRILARWADKTAMVHETTSAESVVSRQEDRVRVMQEDDPAPAQHTRVWIGGADTPTVIPAMRARSVRGITPSGVVDGVRSVVLAAGHVVLYVVSTTVPDLATDIPSAVGALNDKLMQIWPVAHQEISWPPTHLLSGNDIDVLADSIHEDY